MDIVSKNFSIYLVNTYDYDKIMKKWKKWSELIYEYVRTGNYVSHEFRYFYKDFLKYPKHYSYIVNDRPYDTIKIRNTSIQSVEKIINTIEADKTYIKTTLDEIPNNIRELEYETSLQNTYFQDMQDHFNSKRYFLNRAESIDYENLFFYIIGQPFEPENPDSYQLQRKRFIEQYSVLTYIEKYLSNFSNFKNKFSKYLIDNNRFSIPDIREYFIRYLNNYFYEDLHISRLERDTEAFVRSFWNNDARVLNSEGHDVIIPELYQFITPHQQLNPLAGPPLSEYNFFGSSQANYVVSDEFEDKSFDVYDNTVITVDARTNRHMISTHVCNIVLKHVYKAFSPTQSLKDKIRDDISLKIGSLASVLEKYLIESRQDPRLDFAEFLNDSIFHSLSANILRKICSETSGIAETLGVLDNEKESQIINHFLNRVNERTMQPYIFMGFIYKYWPIKFLNVLSLLLREYIETEILTHNERYITETDISVYLKSMQKDKLYESIILSISDTLTPEYIQNIVREKNIIEFAVSWVGSNIIDGFIKSNVFNQYLIELSELISKSLLDSNLIDTKFNWLKCVEGLKLYFKSLLRTEIFNDRLFQEITESIRGDFDYIINSSDIEFYYRDVEYVKKTFEDMCLQEFVIANIYNFVKSIYLATVTKQVYFDVLNFFKVIK